MDGSGWSFSTNHFGNVHIAGHRHGKGYSLIETFNFLQFLARIVTHDIYLILYGFNECFKN